MNEAALGAAMKAEATLGKTPFDERTAATIMETMREGREYTQNDLVTLSGLQQPDVRRMVMLLHLTGRVASDKVEGLRTYRRLS